MRKVLFKKWIPKVMETGLNQIYSTAKAGTNCWEDSFSHEGIFHQWANAYEESSEGFGNYTVALVELSDGTIVEVLPTNLIFVEPMILQ